MDNLNETNLRNLIFFISTNIALFATTIIIFHFGLGFSIYLALAFGLMFLVLFLAICYMIFFVRKESARNIIIKSETMDYNSIDLKGVHLGVIV